MSAPLFGGLALQVIQDVINQINALGKRRNLVEGSQHRHNLQHPVVEDVDNHPTRQLQAARADINDPFYVNGSQYWVDNINASGAWAYTAGIPTVIVAIVDTGADLDHPDLKDNLWVNPGEIPDNGIDDDGNGLIDDVYGWDFAGGCSERDINGKCVGYCLPRNNPYDDRGHGTHVAGLVAAIQNNALGVTGVAPNIKLMILRVADCKSGSMYAGNISAAFNYAWTMGAHVVSCSFGTPSNVLCVGATDPEDRSVSFTNYGYQTVDVGAPGFQIYSTLYTPNSDKALTHTYGPKNGTSMSTPIVSGVAALIAGALGASDGNYYQAAQAKDLIMATATKPTGINLPWVSGSVTNAGHAIYQAIRSLSTISNVSLEVAFPLDPGLPQPVSYQGFAETYYTAVGNQFSQDISGGAVDSGVRSGFSSSMFSAFNGFKWSAGYLVGLEAYMKLEASGLHVMLFDTSADARTLGLYLNDKNIPINSTTREAAFAIPKAGGFHAVSSGGPYSPPDYTLKAPLTSSWQVFYSKAVAADITSKSMSTLAITDIFDYTTDLFPIDKSADAAYGIAAAMIKPQKWNNGVKFKVVCKGCQVLINGLMVVDLHESINLVQSVSKISPCIQLQSDQPYEMAVRFANKGLSTAAMAVFYGDCSSSDPNQQLTPIIESRTIWNPEDAVWSGKAGYIGGLQCDVWRRGDGKRTFAIPKNSPPTWKIRLPDCPDSRLDMSESACGRSWRFRVTNIFFGLNAQSQSDTTVAVRCWTFVDNKFQSDKFSVGPYWAKTTAHLGNRQIWGSNLEQQGTIPSNTNLGGYRQQLTVEWVDVGPKAMLIVMDNGDPITIDMQTMLLPIVPLADSGGTDAYFNQVANANPPGTYSTTVLSGPGDVSHLVNYDLGSYTDAMPKPLPEAIGVDKGLNQAYDYDSGDLASKPYIIKVDELEGTATSVTLGTVSVLNARYYSADSSAASFTFEVFLPSYVNVYGMVIVKSARADPKTYFSFTTLQASAEVDPNSLPDTTWDKWSWSTTYQLACDSGLTVC
eukprot:gene12854-3567_t